MAQTRMARENIGFAKAQGKLAGVGVKLCTGLFSGKMFPEKAAVLRDRAEGIQNVAFFIQDLDRKGNILDFPKILMIFSDTIQKKIDFHCRAPRKTPENLKKLQKLLTNGSLWRNNKKATDFLEIVREEFFRPLYTENAEICVLRRWETS